MTLTEVYWYTLIITGTGLSIKSVELLSTVREYGTRKPFDWCLLGNDAILYSRFSVLFARVYSKEGMLALATTSLISFVGIVAFPFESTAFTASAFAFLAVNIVLYLRQGYGLDGADQMSFLIVLTILSCFLFTTNEEIRQVGVWFLGLQLALSYLVSGMAKLMSKQWRSGAAIQGILSTYTYGSKTAKRYCLRSRGLSIFFCWSVILFEIAFPVSLMCDRDMLWCFIAAGLGFHCVIAAVMGLNDFVWSFAGAYPAYIFIAERL